ncbi:MAG: SlyX family protein [Aestuariivirga sp.]
MSIIEDRIDTLEMRFAQQEKTIGELNDVITALWKKLEAMERQLLRFGAEIETLGSSESPPIQKPPHY